jgi:hypothetical protein
LVRDSNWCSPPTYFLHDSAARLVHAHQVAASQIKEDHMASSNRRASVVSVSKLSATIDKAIASAAARYDIAVKSPNFSGPGHLTGRLFLGDDLTQAFAFAEEVTAKVNKLKGVNAVPALSKIGGQHLVGFLPRSESLLQLGRK